MPVGQSAIGIRGGLLLILLLNVRVDGQLVTLRDVLGDGTFGEIFVTPGVHTVTISNAADTEVLFEDDIFCPDCNPTAVTPPPDTGTNPPAPTAPPTDTLGSPVGSTPSGIQVVLIVLAALSAGVLILTRKRV